MELAHVTNMKKLIYFLIFSAIIAFLGCDGALAQAKLPSPCYVLVFTGPFLPTGLSTSSLVSCSLFVPTSTPSTPTTQVNLTTNTAPHHNLLAWGNAIGTLSGYHIYASDTSINGPFTVIGGTPGNITIFSDSVPPSTKVRYYKVGAYLNNNPDFATTPVITVTIPTTLTSFTLTYTSN